MFSHWGGGGGGGGEGGRGRERGVGGGEKTTTKKKTIAFWENLLGSTNPVPGPIEIFNARCSQSHWNPLKTAVHLHSDQQKNWTLKSPKLFLIASQTRFAQRELTSDSAQRREK